MTDTNSWTVPETGRMRQLGGKLLRALQGQRLLAQPSNDGWLLWQQACGGNNSSATALVRQLTPQALRMAMQLLHHAEDAQDAVQDSFLRLWNSQAEDTGGAQLSTYFNTIVINRCKTQLIRKRELSTEPDALADQADGQQTSAGALHHPPFSAVELQAALASLPPRQRMALAMWAYSDAQAPEIAHALDLEVNAAHQLLFRAKQSLRTVLRGANL